MIDFVQIGKKITKLRRSLDWSQEDLANNNKASEEESYE